MLGSNSKTIRSKFDFQVSSRSQSLDEESLQRGSMATKSKNIAEYIERRVRELISSGWPDWKIIQQLEAVVGRKAVVAEMFSQRN